MHPESISCDVTFGTENTKKQLFDFAAVDGNNKAFNCGRAYIPNGQTWVFWYCFKYCLPVFWGPVVTERLCVMSTDGCPQEYLPFIQNTGLGTTFPNATHSLCYFHTAILGFNHNVSFPKPGQTPDQQAAIETVRFFVRSWFFDLETREEYEYSRAALRKYLGEGGGKVLPQHTVDSIKAWLTTSLEKSETMSLNYLRLHV
ncbi:MULE transposase domain containing protein [Nitzschia inconspicua]|uniref:MULE transposase domain containing protein n=1 Tax=Nitzschia inconspicua TaxID=303405 RepID=A0A9K3PS97_9STRA|nr:MULE transposase domain containing protein [Nitzschia inconspicua]